MEKSAFHRATLGQAIMIGMLCGILIITREVQGFSTVSLWKPQITRQLPLPNRHVVLYNSYLDGLPLNTESSSSTASTSTAEAEEVTTEEESSTEQDSNTSPVISMSEETARSSMIRAQKKRALLQLLGGTTTTQEEEELSPDPVLADPLTKEPLLVRISSRGPGLLLGNGGSVPISLTLQTNKNDNNIVYSGRTDTYLNLLEPADTAAAADEDQNDTTRNKSPWNWNAVRVFVPPPLRSVVSSVLWSNNNNKDDSDKDAYIPMRDLFTSPAVSFAYERGWRQGFAAAGFPGADTEYELVRDFFAPLTDKSVVVDMSCATGLFTRRLAKGGDFGRVLGCDYSESMLMEARRRIQAESSLRSSSTMTNNNSKLQLVRCDVGQIPMQTASVPAVHAGAAMHCWPDLPAALSEIYRVLQPGGRYFASTFLSSYFQTLQLASSNGGGDDDAVNIQSQAFQYFESTDMIQSLLVQAGFEPEKIQIEILGSACIIIRCEK